MGCIQTPPEQAHESRLRSSAQVTLMPSIKLFPNSTRVLRNTYPPTAVLSLPRHDSPQLIPPQKPRSHAQKVPIRRYDDSPPQSISPLIPSSTALVCSTARRPMPCFPSTFLSPEHIFPVARARLLISSIGSTSPSPAHPACQLNRAVPA